jgi:hypothetical protein
MTRNIQDSTVNAHWLPCCTRSAGWQPAVSPTGSRLARVGRRLPTCDTADYQFALPRRPSVGLEFPVAESGGTFGRSTVPLEVGR